MRVTRPGGRIGIVSWMPEQFGGDFFRAHAKYLPPPPGLVPPSRWGTEGGARELLGPGVSSFSFERLTFHQYFRTEAEAFQTFRSYFGPSIRVLSTLEPARHAEFEKDILDVFHHYNRATDGTAKIESTCMQVLATRS